MNENLDIESVLDQMRGLLEYINRAAPDARYTLLMSLKAILKSLVEVDQGACVVVLSTDLKGKLAVCTLNANADVMMEMVRTVAENFGSDDLKDVPVEELGAMQ